VVRRAVLLDPTRMLRRNRLVQPSVKPGSRGIHYPGVRDSSGRCVVAFRPTAVGVPSQERHLEYDRDGEQVRRYFDYRDDVWVDLPRAAARGPSPWPADRSHLAALSSSAEEPIAPVRLEA
jgi:hypothetical protein